MNINEKIKILKSLSEAELRQDLIIPLLNRIGYYYPIENHGQGERGKDILFYEKNLIGNKVFNAAVVKTGDVTGDISSSRAFREIIYQIEQCFNIPYKNVYNMKECLVEHVFFITSGIVKSNSENSIFETLKKQNLDKLITIISQDKLIDLIDSHFDSYWNSSNETKESLLIQRDRIIKFLGELFKKIGVSDSNNKEICKQILHSKYDISLFEAKEIYKFKSHGSFITVANKNENDFEHFYSDQCGLINKHLSNLRDNIKSCMYDVEEILEHYNKLMEIEDPQQFISYFEENLEGEYPFEDKIYGKSSDVLNGMEYLNQGLYDFSRFNLFLEDNKIKQLYYINSKYLNSCYEVVKEIIDLCTNQKIIIYVEEDINSKIRLNQIQNANTIITFEKNKTEEKVRRFLMHEEKIQVEIKPDQIIDDLLYKYRNYIEEKYEYDWEKYSKLID